MSEEFEVENIVSVDSFKKNYNKVLKELDALARGTFDETEAKGVAALCLLTQVGIIKLLSNAEQTARGLKRDLEFAKSDAYYRIRETKDSSTGKKIAETAVSNLVPRDEEVNKVYQEWNTAEKEAKELNTILNILKDAHVTFRSLKEK